jgi:hypothetical protein
VKRIIYEAPQESKLRRQKALSENDGMCCFNVELLTKEKERNRGRDGTQEINLTERWLCSFIV